MNFTIEDARRVQRDLRLGDRHVAYIDPDEGFVLAHTDAERDSGMDLAECETHRALCDTPPSDLSYEDGEPGWYQITASELKVFGLPVYIIKGLAL